VKAVGVPPGTFTPDVVATTGSAARVIVETIGLAPYMLASSILTAKKLSARSAVRHAHEMLFVSIHEHK
jgi:hypothetical protein